MTEYLLFWFFLKGGGGEKQYRRKYSTKITLKNGRQIDHPYRRNEGQSESSRDVQPHLGSLVFLSYITNVPLRLSVPLFFFLLTCQANESDPRDLQLQGPSNPIKAFQIKLNTYLFP